MIVSLVLNTVSAIGYVNKAKQFSFDPPAGWIQNVLPGVEVAFISDQPIRDFTPNINVVTEIVSADMTVQMYSDIVQKKHKRFLKNSLIVKTEKTKLNGHPAQKISTVGYQNGYSLRYITVIAVRNQQVYVMTGTTLNKGDQKFDSLFSKVMSSFKFLR